MTSIAIVDYGVGNVRSVQKALERAAADRQAAGVAHGATVTLTHDAGAILAADGVVLPGVGAFGECITNLRRAQMEGLVREVIARQTPLLGICVGMQILFDSSEEMGDWPGLGILPGRVLRFRGEGRVPQIGWNQLEPQRADPLLQGIAPGAYAYFVHSYYCHADDSADVLAATDYGVRYASVVNRGHVWGIQCHPEKSQAVGLGILGNFVGIVERQAAGVAR